MKLMSFIGNQKKETSDAFYRELQWGAGKQNIPNKKLS